MTAYVFSKAIWQHMNYFIHPQLDWHTIQTLKWWWDHITKIKFIKQYPLRNSLPVHLTNMHKHGCWSWQWKAMTSLIDSIPPCCVQFLCATVTLFSSIFCFSEKLPSLFLRSFRITTWRKNTSGEKNHRFSTTAIHLSFPRNVHTKKYFRNTCLLLHCWSFG